MGLQASAGWEGVMPNADNGNRMLNVQVTLETFANFNQIDSFHTFYGIYMG